MAAPRFDELAPLTQRCVTEGIARFNAGAFWSAHEAWEEAWLEEDGPTKLWLQALIQLTAAFHKGLRMRHPAGMARLFEASADKLRALSAEGPSFGGLELDSLLRIALSGQSEAQRWDRGESGGFAIELVPCLPHPTHQ